MKIACFDKINNLCVFEYEDDYTGCNECFKDFNASKSVDNCIQCKRKVNQYCVVMGVEENLFFVSCLGITGKKNSKFQTKFYSDTYFKANKMFKKKAEEAKTVEAISIHNTKHFISEINSALSGIIKEKDLLQKNTADRLDLIVKEINLNTVQIANKLQDTFRNAKRASLAYSAADYFSKESELQKCDFADYKIHGLVVSMQYLYDKALKDKKIFVHIVGDVRDISVHVNYASIKIAFDQIFNNILKYSQEDSRLFINFEKNIINFIDIIFTMDSVCVGKDEQKEIGKLGFRGAKAKEYSPEGEGIGMSVIRKIISLNKGQFDFKHGQVCASINGIPFCKNKFIVRLLLSK